MSPRRSTHMPDIIPGEQARMWEPDDQHRLQRPDQQAAVDLICSELAVSSTWNAWPAWPGSPGARAGGVAADSFNANPPRHPPHRHPPDDDVSTVAAPPPVSQYTQPSNKWKTNIPMAKTTM